MTKNVVLQDLIREPLGSYKIVPVYKNTLKDSFHHQIEEDEEIRITYLETLFTVIIDSDNFRQ